MISKKGLMFLSILFFLFLVHTLVIGGEATSLYQKKKGVEKPDLRITELIMDPSTIKKGGELIFSYRILNEGSVTVSMVTVKTYFSNDRTFSPSRDVVLSNRQIVAIPAGGTSRGEVRCKLPESALEGRRNIYVIIDPDNRIEESNKRNNLRLSSLTVVK